MVLIPLVLAFYAFMGAHAQPEWGPPPPWSKFVARVHDLPEVRSHD